MKKITGQITHEFFGKLEVDLVVEDVVSGELQKDEEQTLTPVEEGANAIADLYTAYLIQNSLSEMARQTTTQAEPETVPLATPSIFDIPAKSFEEKIEPEEEVVSTVDMNRGNTGNHQQEGSRYVRLVSTNKFGTKYTDLRSFDSLQAVTDWADVKVVGVVNGVDRHELGYVRKPLDVDVLLEDAIQKGVSVSHNTTLTELFLDRDYENSPTQSNEYIKLYFQ